MILATKAWVEDLLKNFKAAAGKDGKDGVDGKDGAAGADGIGLEARHLPTIEHQKVQRQNYNNHEFTVNMPKAGTLDIIAFGMGFRSSPGIGHVYVYIDGAGKGEMKLHFNTNTLGVHLVLSPWIFTARVPAGDYKIKFVKQSDISIDANDTLSVRVVKHLDGDPIGG